MTDVVALAKKLYRKINQQRTPEQVEWTDLTHYIADAIEALYVVSGRTLRYSEDKMEYDESGAAVSFSENMELDEREWV